MHRNVLLALGGFVYYGLSLYALLSFNSGILLSSLLLFGIPAYVLARYSAAPAPVLIAVAVLGAGIAVLFGGIAHIYGIWYTVGVDELRLFGLIPVEVITASVLQLLFLVLLYELFFDDGEYSQVHARTRFTAFGVFCVSVMALIGIHHYILNGIFFTHSYLWLLGVLLVSSISALAVRRSLSLAFFDRVALFSLIAMVPLLVNLIVAVYNTHRVFAHVGDYVYTFTFFGSAVPLEEVLLALTVPFFVAVFYELYLDDGSVTERSS